MELVAAQQGLAAKLLQFLVAAVMGPAASGARGEGDEALGAGQVITDSAVPLHLRGVAPRPPGSQHLCSGPWYLHITAYILPNTAKHL